MRETDPKYNIKTYSSSKELESRLNFMRQLKLISRSNPWQSCFVY